MRFAGAEVCPAVEGDRAVIDVEGAADALE
jgi:hypothetical protein